MFNTKPKAVDPVGATNGAKPESANIFDELGNLDYGKEVKQESQEKVPKDKIYYMKLASTILISLNIVIFFALALLVTYVKIQTNAEMKEIPYLDPVCGILLGSEIGDNLSPCSSVTAMIAKYQADYQVLSTDLGKKTLTVAEGLFKVQNFANSPEVQFVVNNKTRKLKILDVLNSFDLMKTDYALALGDKNSVQCDNMTVTQDYILSATCVVYSRGWDEPTASGGKGIVGGEGNTKILTQGTSISVASSFLNFIEKNPSYKFTVVEKQKQFSNSTTIGEGELTKQTSLQLKLRYDDFENNLSL